MNGLNQQFFECDCGIHGILATCYTDDVGTDIDLTFYRASLYNNKPNFFSRLRLAWILIKTGRLDADSVILSLNSAEKLSKWLHECSFTHHKQYVKG